MPLLGKTRIEFYIPCLPNKVYKILLLKLQEELTFTFGGCTLLEKVEGWYQARDPRQPRQYGKIILDVVNILFVDVELSIVKDSEVIEKYFAEVSSSINDELQELAIFITANMIWHYE